MLTLTLKTNKQNNSRSENSPCLLDEADHKLFHFDGLVCLESDHLLQEKKQNKNEANLNETTAGYERQILAYLHPKNCREEMDPC